MRPAYEACAEDTALLFTMPGVPAIYDGSEWGLGGVKRRDDDWPLRPRLTWPDVKPKCRLCIDAVPPCWARILVLW